jgi:hypothetical protein
MATTMEQLGKYVPVVTDTRMYGFVCMGYAEE